MWRVQKEKHTKDEAGHKDADNEPKQLVCKQQWKRRKGHGHLKRLGRAKVRSAP